MDTYSLNPQILPGEPLSDHDHRKVRSTLIAAILIAAAIGAALWLSVVNTHPAPVAADKEAQLRSEVAALLRGTPVNASQAEIDKMASLLAKSKAKTTEQDRQNVANAMKN